MFLGTEEVDRLKFESDTYLDESLTKFFNNCLKLVCYITDSRKISVLPVLLRIGYLCDHVKHVDLVPNLAKTH